MNRPTAVRRSSLAVDRKARVPMSRVTNARVSRAQQKKPTTSQAPPPPQKVLKLEKLPEFKFTPISVGNPMDVRDVAEIENEIYRTMRQEELKEPPFQWNQQSITLHDRAMIIDSIDRAHYKFECTTNTFYRFIGIFDRYLLCTQVTASKLKLVAYASFLIAAKIEEIYPPSSSDIISQADRAFTRSELFAMEIQIANAIHFNTTFPTGLFFLTHFLSIVGENQETMLFARYILEISQTCDKFWGYKQSMLASLAILTMQIVYHQSNRWPDEFAKFTGYSLADLEQPLSIVAQMLREAERPESRFMRRKYGSDIFRNVSHKPIPSSLK